MAVAIKPQVPSPAAKPGADARFESLVLDFLSYLELERGLSRNTLNAYRTDLFQYGEYLAAHERDALQASGADIADFLAELATGEGRPACSAATIHRKAACLRSFYKHLRRDELIGDDPTAALSAPRRSKKLPHVLNYSEVQKLLASPKGSEPTALRDLVEPLAGQRPAAEVDEQLRLVPVADQLRAAAAQVAGDRGDRLAAERHQPLLRALAAGAQDALAEVDISELQPDRLRGP